MKHEGFSVKLLIHWIMDKITGKEKNTLGRIWLAQQRKNNGRALEVASPWAMARNCGEVRPEGGRWAWRDPRAGAGQRAQLDKAGGEAGACVRPRLREAVRRRRTCRGILATGSAGSGRYGQIQCASAGNRQSGRRSARDGSSGACVQGMVPAPGQRRQRERGALSERETHGKEGRDGEKKATVLGSLMYGSDEGKEVPRGSKEMRRPVPHRLLGLGLLLADYRHTEVGQRSVRAYRRGGGWGWTLVDSGDGQWRLRIGRRRKTRKVVGEIGSGGDPEEMPESGGGGCSCGIGMDGTARF